MNVIDLFSGVGGLSLGFVQTGFNIVLANEIDIDIAYSYKRNNPRVQMINADITSLDISSVFYNYREKTEVIIGGPPCQGFSQKGSRKTIHDERNYLFRYFSKVIEYVRPKYVVMENVPNILTAENGMFKREILNLFCSMGYTVDCKILDASEYGVPQHRKRAIFLAKQGNRCCFLPPPLNERVTIWDAISDLAFLDSGEGTFSQSYPLKPMSLYQLKLRENSHELYNHISTAHSKESIRKMDLIPPGKGKEVLPLRDLTKSIYSGTWSRMIHTDQSVTITTRYDTPSSGRFMHPFLNRCITSREAARLQSFPDTFIFYGPKSSQMKQIGNAVPPILSNAIATAIKKDMEK